MARVMLAAVFFIILMSVGASAVNYQGESLGKQYDIEGETAQPDGATFTAGELVNLTHSHTDGAVYEPAQDTTVRGDANELAVEGEDFEWNRDNGTLTILAGGVLEGDSDASVDYGFHIPSQRQKDISTLIGSELVLAKGLVYAFGAILGITFLRLLAGAS